MKEPIKGIFLVFQSPPDMGGLPVGIFLRETTAKRGIEAGINEINNAQVELSDHYLSRNLYEDFSWRRKETPRVAQALLSKPQILILDELDSGLARALERQLLEHLRDELRYLPPPPAGAPDDQGFPVNPLLPRRALGKRRARRGGPPAARPAKARPGFPLKAAASGRSVKISARAMERPCKPLSDLLRLSSAASKPPSTSSLGASRSVSKVSL
jgi:hypothetical protein